MCSQGLEGGVVMTMIGRSFDSNGRRPEANDFVEILRMRADTRADKTAYVFLDDGEREGERVSYGELDKSARAIAARLVDIGLVGRCAILLYPPSLSYIEAFFGCLYAGVIAVPAYPPTGRHFDRLKAIFEDASPAAILSTEALASRFRASAEKALAGSSARWLTTDRVDPADAASWRARSRGADEVAFLQYTSGSTSDPRGVMVTHANLLSNQALIKESFAHDDETTLVGWLPLYHDMGLIGNVLQPLYIGATAYLMSPTAFLEKPARWLRAISNYRAHTSGGPNFAFDLCARKITEEEKAGLDLSGWRIAFSGAEPVRLATIDRFVRAYAGCGFLREAFLPCYGLAEATLVVTSPGRDRPLAIMNADRDRLNFGIAEPSSGGEAVALVGCGRAWPGYDVQIVDPETSALRRPGELGEIWVSGPGVARGYWGRMEETERTFRAKIVGDEKRAFLRTGDLGVFQGGDLFIAGRLKDVIISAGRNFYPQDIEGVVEERVPGVRAGCVAAFPVVQADGEAIAVALEPDRAFLNAATEVDRDALFHRVRRCIAEEVGVEPTHLILVQPGSIPKTSSGKIRRSECRRLYDLGELKALGSWSVARIEEDARSSSLDCAATTDAGFLRRAIAYVDPKDRGAIVTRFLVAIAAETLGVSSGDLDEACSFMSAGLTSLRAVELKHRVDGALDVAAPIGLFLSDASVTKVSESIVALLETSNCRDREEDASAGSSADLSYGQKSMWAVHQLDDASSCYNLHLALRMDGPIDVRALQAALRDSMERRDQLRATFRAGVDGPEARTLAVEEVGDVIQRMDASSLLDDELRAVMSTEIRRPFDLESQPPLRIRVFDLGEKGAALLFVAHHISVDLWSLVLLLTELEKGYLSEGAGRGSISSSVSGYGRYIAGEARYLRTEQAERDWSYWRSRLDGRLPALDLTRDFPRPAAADYRGGSEPLRLDEDTTRRLKGIARESNISLYSLLLAVYFVLLHRTTGQSDIVVGAAASGRTDASLASVVGNCVNPIALRNAISSDLSFIDFAERTNEIVKGAIEHQRFPFQLLVERLKPNRDAEWPIFQTWFVLQQAQSSAKEGIAALALGEDCGPFDLFGRSARSLALLERIEMFDLKVMAAEIDRGLLLSFQYRRQAFERSTVVTLADCFARLVRAVVDARNKRIGDLSMLDEREEGSVKAAATGATPREGGHRLLHDLIGATAKATDTAVSAADGNLTYGELEARSNRIARALQGKGVGPESVVGILLEPGVEAIASIVGALKAGAAFLALDPRYPPDRLRYMMSDSRARALISTSWLAESTIGNASIPSAFVDPSALGDIADDPVVCGVVEDNIAYVVYTSGSTGRAKGVVATHRNAVWSVAARLQTYEEPVDGFLLLSSLSFDSSFAGLFWTLSQGGRLCVPEEATRRDVFALGDLIVTERISHLLCLPSLYHELLDALADRGRSAPSCCIVAGEICRADVVERHHATSPEALLFNEYGPTEGSVWCAVHRVGAGDGRARAVSIGRPIPGARVFVLDRGGSLAPVGVAGEIHISGEGVVRGYLERPDLTAEKFVPDPFGGGGGRLYRTGDRARYRSDGTLEFLGRIDEQVKIRGHRIEIGEIELALAQAAGGKETAVSVLSDATGNSRLIGYVAGTQSLDVAKIKNDLRRDLPDYMIPQFIIALENFPRVANGKVDRKALPSPDLNALAAKSHVAPRTHVEAAICAVFEEVLHVGRVGVDDDFFDMGGDSIRAIQVASRLRARGLHATPRDVFHDPTASSLAPRLHSLETSDAPRHSNRASEGVEAFSLAEMDPADLEKVKEAHGDVEDIYPLTPMQEGMLFHARLQSGSGLYLMQDRYEIKGALDIEAFIAAWRDVVARHGVLRTSFDWRGKGRPHQLVHRNAILLVDALDLRKRTPQAQQSEIDDCLAAEREAGFDLSRAPLMRLRIFRLQDERYICVRSFHHIIMDDWCTSPLLLDVRRHYAARVRGEPLGFEAAPQFKEYLAWLRAKNMDAAESYWRRYLDGFVTPTPLVGAKPSVGHAVSNVEDVTVELSDEAWRRLKTLVQENRSTLNTYVQGALALALGRLGGVEDVVFGVTVSGRPVELDIAESALGLFINSLPLRVRLDRSKRVVDWLGEILANNLDMRQFEFVSQSSIQQWSSISRSDALIFQHLLTFENAPLDPSLRGDKDVLDIDLLQLRVHTNYPLTFVAIPESVLTLRLTYDADRFERTTADRTARAFLRALEQLVAKNDCRLCDLDLLEPSERDRLAGLWSGRPHDHGEPEGFVGRFEAQVDASGNRIAASVGGASITYCELDARANRLAHALMRSGVGPEVLVAVLEDRGIDFLVAILAIFKAGGAYLPLDPAHPDGRIAQVLSESGVARLLVGRAYLDRARALQGADGLGAALRTLDAAELEASEERADRPGQRHAPDNLAFVIFTSGSTGKPKGAMVEHKGMFNNLITKVPTLGLVEEDVIAQTASQCFDISVWQFLTALTVGARVEIFPDAVSRDPSRLAGEIAARGVTVLEAVPSMIRALLEIEGEGPSLPGLRWLLPCGEAFSPELCRRFMDRHAEIRLLNAYGPAECSDDVTYHPIDTPPSGNESSVPIGAPVDNTQIYLLDRRQELAPFGVDAEICVAGVQVGRGYLRRADLTAAAFLPDPFGDPGTRLYRTGDLGRYREDGAIDFLGRIDHQVKIRGHRIEPGEIEACLSTHPRVRAVAVIADQSSPGVFRLVAYVVGDGGAVAPEGLRDHLRRVLPDYMIPSVFVGLGALPLTPNGKLDRKALPEPDVGARFGHVFVAPRNRTEEMLARIWAEVLRIDEIGVHDNFFDLGGHSLLSTQIASRIRNAFGFDVPLKAVFEAQTVAEMAEVVDVGLLIRDASTTAAKTERDYEIIDL